MRRRRRKADLHYLGSLHLALGVEPSPLIINFLLENSVKVFDIVDDFILDDRFLIHFAGALNNFDQELHQLLAERDAV